MSKLRTFYFSIQFYALFVIVKWLTFYYRIVGYKNAKKDVLYLESFTLDGAGYNYRVKHWQNLLLSDGFTVESLFITQNSKDLFFQTIPENLPNFIIRSIRIRIKQIQYARDFKVVIVRRNLLLYCQYGNLFMEKLLEASHPNRVLDFDDDIGATVQQGKDNLFQKLMLTVDDHFYFSFKYYNGFIPGSSYLGKLVKSKVKEIAENRICIIPTCVNYDIYHPKLYNIKYGEDIKFGWIGGNHNLELLKNIIPAMNKVHNSHRLRLLVIAGVKDYDLGSVFPVKFEMYSLENEVEYLKTIDIGLMPLVDNMVSRGKCVFKLLQYMGLGIPGIASAITVNKEIIDDNVNGWLVSQDGDWEAILRKVISNWENWPSIGNRAFSTVKERYSFTSNYPICKKYICNQIDKCQNK